MICLEDPFEEEGRSSSNVDKGKEGIGRDRLSSSKGSSHYASAQQRRRIPQSGLPPLSMVVHKAEESHDSSGRTRSDERKRMSWEE